MYYVECTHKYIFVIKMCELLPPCFFFCILLTDNTDYNTDLTTITPRISIPSTPTQNRILTAITPMKTVSLSVPKQVTVFTKLFTLPVSTTTATSTVITTSTTTFTTSATLPTFPSTSTSKTTFKDFRTKFFSTKESLKLKDILSKIQEMEIEVNNFDKFIDYVQAGFGLGVISGVSVLIYIVIKILRKSYKHGIRLGGRENVQSRLLDETLNATAMTSFNERVDKPNNNKPKKSKTKTPKAPPNPTDQKPSCSTSSEQKSSTSSEQKPSCSTSSTQKPSNTAASSIEESAGNVEDIVIPDPQNNPVSDICVIPEDVSGSYEVNV